ncbi:GumC family protein [Antarctobacter jejuensis]|uniref:GumC family protein n=1 Tax=Antarctobacter jejuensis TaxID=1439938 RepID=UPI003FD477B8
MTLQDTYTDQPRKGPALSVFRTPLRQLSIKRLFLGGRPADLGRLPRYAGIFLLSTAAIWAPITGYLKTAPLKFSSHMSLILPGSGASASVNLNDIGQASSFASSAFASNSISPTETYKRLLGAGRILEDAAGRHGIHRNAFGEPKIRLVDQTAFIHVEITGGSPEDAQGRNAALLAAFFDEIDRLRADEMSTREDGGLDAIREYQASVAGTRDDIATLQRETGLRSAAQYDRLVEDLDSLRAQVDSLTTELERSEGAVQRLETRLGTDAEHAALILRVNADSSYVALLETMSAAAADLADVRSRYGSRHPKVQSAQAAHDAAEAKAAALVAGITANRIDLEVASNGGRTDLLTDLVRQESERNGIAMQLAELTGQLRAETARLDDLAPAAARLEDMQRDFSVAEAVFASAIARTESSKSDIYASYPLVQVLEDPTLPDEPTSPKRKLAVAAGIAATFMVLMSLLLGWLRKPLIEKLLVRKDAKA